MEINDLTEDKPLPQPEKWIGRGLQWPEAYDKVPDELKDIYNERMKIPVEYEIIHDPEEKVSAFLTRDFRRQGNELTHLHPSRYFSNHPPTTLPDSDDNTTLPCASLLSALKEWSGQALLTGAQSVMNPHNHRRYPLWVVTYWLQVQFVLTLQAKWKSSREWLG